jgi:hypothetical protein
MAVTSTYGIADRILVNEYTAVVRGETAAKGMPGWRAEAHRTVHACLSRTQVNPSGPPFARDAFLDELAAIEAGFPMRYALTGQSW